MRLNVYVDGFNLYYCALKGTPYKWLNISQLVSFYFPQPNFQINKIKYFTAQIKARKDNPDKKIRQQMYLRALATISNLEIIKGYYSQQIKSMPLVSKTKKGRRKINVSLFSTSLKLPLVDDDNLKKLQYALVYKTEEKGSDVNLATHLVNDAHNNDFDIAVVLSNDSDLATPIKIVNEEINLPVGVLNTAQNNSTKWMRGVVDFRKQIRSGSLMASQFSNQLSDSNGVFHKPSSW